MKDVLALMEEYRDAITAAGVRCVIDPKDVNPPAVLLRVTVLNFRFGRGCFSGEWAAWLYLPDTGTYNALKTGLPILTTVTDALATVGVAVLSATPEEFQTADGATVPGFILNWSTSH